MFHDCLPIWGAPVVRRAHSETGCSVRVLRRALNQGHDDEHIPAQFHLQRDCTRARSPGQQPCQYHCCRRHHLHAARCRELGQLQPGLWWMHRRIRRRGHDPDHRRPDSGRYAVRHFQYQVHRHGRARPDHHDQQYNAPFLDWRPIQSTCRQLRQSPAQGRHGARRQRHGRWRCRRGPRRCRRSL